MCSKTKLLIAPTANMLNFCQLTKTLKFSSHSDTVGLLSDTASCPQQYLTPTHLKVYTGGRGLTSWEHIKWQFALAVALVVEAAAV